MESASGVEEAVVERSGIGRGSTAELAVEPLRHQGHLLLPGMALKVQREASP